MSIHAFHGASFWLALFLSLSGAICLLAAGAAFELVTVSLVVLLAFTASVSGTLTDLMSMRIPDRLTLMVLAAALGWWGLEFFGMTPKEGSGALRSIVGLALPDQGSGGGLPSLDGWFPFAWIVLDLLLGAAILFSLCASYFFGIGLGGGDVKLMTALTLFLGWPLGFDFVAMTYLFGGLMSIGILAIKYTSKVIVASGSQDPKLQRLSKIKSFAYAPAITISAVICIGQKTQGLLQ